MGKLIKKVIDKIIGSDLMIFDNRVLGKTAEFNQFIAFDQTSVDLAHYDVVDISQVNSVDIEPVVKKVGRVELERFFQKPPLVDFILKLKDSDGAEVKFLLHCYGKRRQQIFADDRRVYLPLFDITQFDGKGRVLSIAQIIAPKSQFPNGYMCRLVAMQSCLTRDINTQKEMYSFMVTAANYVFYHYAFVAQCFHERPERIVKTRDGERQRFSVQPDPVKSPHEVKIEKLIQPEQSVVNDEQTVSNNADETDSKNRRVITCPYWTVAGHHRTLKSGKVIWIEPYAKGRDRNNPDRNVAKTYVPSIERSDKN